MAKIYDFNEHRLNKMSPWEKVMEMDRQARRAVTELNNFNSSFDKAKATIPVKKTISVGKIMFGVAVVVIGISYLAGKNK